MDEEIFNSMTADLSSFDDLIAKIKIKYEKLENMNKALREENEKLKSEVWKDEEMARMKTRYEEMKQDYYRGFPITKEQQKKIDDFKRSHCLGKPGQYKIDASGTRFCYVFQPTPLGVSGKIKCTDGSEFEFQELN